MPIVGPWRWRPGRRPADACPPKHRAAAVTPVRTRRLPPDATAALLVVPVLFLNAGTAPVPVARPPVEVQVLSFNDFHGNLEQGDLSIDAATGASRGPGAVPAGGAAHLAAWIAAAKRSNPASVVVSSGDLIGASPLISGYFHDEPTIETMNEILDVTAVGNHEFDEGASELRRMVAGGCHPVDGCQDGTGFTGARFDVLAANVVLRSTGRPIFPGWTVKRIGGARIGFIGTVTTDTPSLVAAAGIKDVRFLDEAATVRALAPKLRAAGADAVIVLTHSGAAPSSGTKGGINDCPGVTGPAVDLARAVAGRVDAVLSAHTHQPYVCSVAGTLLSSGASFGRLLTTVKLTVDPVAHRVTRISARNAVVSHAIRPDAVVAATVGRYRRQIAPIAGRPVATLTRTVTRQATRAGESAFVNLVADAQLHATRPRSRGGAQLAVVAHGLVRTDLERGPATYGQIWAGQPFGHRLVTLTLTGRQLETVLEQQFCHPAASGGRLTLGVSAGFAYRFSPARPCGDRIRIGDLRLHGTPVTANGTYRVTTNSFFAAGGHGFPVFAAGTRRVTGVLDRDAVAGYLRAHPNLTPPARDRIGLR